MSFSQPFILSEFRPSSLLALALQEDVFEFHCRQRRMTFQRKDWAQGWNTVNSEVATLLKKVLYRAPQLKLIVVHCTVRY